MCSYHYRWGCNKLATIFSTLINMQVLSKRFCFFEWTDNHPSSSYQCWVECPTSTMSIECNMYGNPETKLLSRAPTRNVASLFPFIAMWKCLHSSNIQLIYHANSIMSAVEITQSHQYFIPYYLIPSSIRFTSNFSPFKVSWKWVKMRYEKWNVSNTHIIKALVTRTS